VNLIMEDLIREANEIVENVAKEDRKEEAFGCISAGVVIAGLMMCDIEAGKERVEMPELMRQSAISILADSGFNVSGKPKEFEAKFMMMLLELTFAKSSEDVDLRLRKTFEKMIWNVCLFDARG